MKNKSIIKDCIYQLKEIFRALFPENKNELFLLLGIMTFYFSYSVIISILTPAIIQGPPYLSVDTYFSFDNKLFYHNNVLNYIGHPLIKLFVTPIVFLGNLCNYIIEPTLGKRLFISFICTFLVSSSAVYVNRYLRHVIDLKKQISYLLTFLFVFFSTNIILSFTIETYTFSLFFLSFTLCYLSLKIKKNEQIPLFSSTLLALILGGITITNFAKGLIPTCFSNKKWKDIIKNGIYSSIIFLLILVVMILTSSQTDTNALSYYSQFSESAGNSLYEKYIDMFIGSPILLAGFFSRLNEPPFPPMIVLDFYHHWWQYCIIGLLFTLVFLSIILLYKNKFVQMLSAFISIDIIIHVILKFGINDAFIYGAHWVYLIPLFIGWLYTKLPQKAIKPYLYLTSIICVAVMTNNMVRLYQFIKLAQEIYPIN